MMSQQSRRELLAVVVPRYRAAHGTDRKRILNEFVGSLGYHRKYAIQLPRFRPKCSPFDFRLKRPRTAVAEARAETPGTYHVLWDVLVANERVPLPLCLSI